MLSVVVRLLSERGAARLAAGGSVSFPCPLAAAGMSGAWRPHRSHVRARQRVQLYREVDTAKLRRKDRGREKSMAIVQPKQYGERTVPSGVADIELLQEARMHACLRRSHPPWQRCGALKLSPLHSCSCQ
jgi:hypothetical protein